MPPEHPAARSTCGPHAQQRCRQVLVIGHTSEISVWRLSRTWIPEFHTEHCHSLVVCCRCCCSLLDSTECLTLPKRLCTFDPSWEVEKVENASLIPNCETVEHNESQQWQAVTFSGMHAKYAATLTSQARKQRHFLRWEIYWNANRPPAGIVGPLGKDT